MTVQVTATRRPSRLTAESFERLAEVPTELEWFANLMNDNTKRAYQTALDDFKTFAGDLLGFFDPIFPIKRLGLERGDVAA